MIKGETPLLVLMPGLDGTGALFERFIAELPPGIRTRVVKYPSKGLPSLEEHAAPVRELLARESHRVILLAESFSGLVALHLLGEVQEKIGTVVFVASFADAPRRYLKPLAFTLPALARGIKYVPDVLLRRYCLGPQASKSDILQLRAVLERVDPAVIAHRLNRVAVARRPSWDRIPVPAFYLQASGDRLVPRRAGTAMRGLFADFTLLPLVGPHFLLQASPSESAQAVADIMVRMP